CGQFLQRHQRNADLLGAVIGSRQSAGNKADDAWRGVLAVWTACKSIGALLLLLCARRVTAAGLCPGDCSGDGVGAIDELIGCVDAASSTFAGADRSCCDLDADGAVEIAELLAATGRAVRGCADVPTPTPTPTRAGSPHRGATAIAAIF